MLNASELVNISDGSAAPTIIFSLQLWIFWSITLRSVVGDSLQFETSRVSLTTNQSRPSFLVLSWLLTRSHFHSVLPFTGLVLYQVGEKQFF